MLCTIPAAVIDGVDGQPVRVEVHTSNGAPGFLIIGLPDASCREARDRVRAAILSSGRTWTQHRVTVNLAPSDVPKSGPALDLAMALGFLVATGQLPPSAVCGVGALGELGLDGTIRPVIGMVALAGAVDADTIVVPPGQADQASVIRPDAVLSAPTLSDLLDGLQGQGSALERIVAPKQPHAEAHHRLELADVRGQGVARRALEVAAAGHHHLLMVGPPGAGKTMLAQRLPDLLPALDVSRALTVTKVHSVAGQPIPDGGLILRPPFRAPHHGASMVSLIGGGSRAIRPGEISLATEGVLFLDELGEFPVAVLEALRQPLEEGVVRIARARASAVMPAAFQLIAAMNPCPCGEARPGTSCRCSDHARARYARRLSAPLLDRFDLRIEVQPPDPETLLSGERLESSEQVADRVARVRALADTRGFGPNAQIPSDQLDQVAPLTADARRLLEGALRQGALTGRGLRRVRAVARTVADLADNDGPIREADAATALTLRATPFSVVGR